MDEFKEEIKVGKHLVYWSISVLIVISVIVGFLNRTVAVVDSGIVHYEEFQEIYNTCYKLNTDLCNMKSVPESDKMFEQFSKAQRLNTLRSQLNRWVEDYNAKSKMFNRSLWKSSSLPYELNVNQFNCY